MINTKLPALFAVAVGFCRSESVPSHILQIRIEFEQHTKLGNVGDAVRRLVFQRRIDFAVPCHLVGHKAF